MYDNEDRILDELMMGIEEIERYKSHGTYGFDNLQLLKDRIIYHFNNKIKRNIVTLVDPKFKSLSSEEIDYIIQNIKDLNEQYFYSLSLTSHIQIINNLIYQKYNKAYYLQKNMYEMLKTDHFDNKDLHNKGES